MTTETKLTKEEMTIIKLWESGYSGSQIAAEIGVTRNTVMGKVYRLRRRALMASGHEPMKSRPDIKIALPKSAPKQAKIPQKVVMLPVKRNAWVPTPDPSVVKTSADGLTFWELKPGMCRYSISGESLDTYRFCSEPAVKMSYCAHHYGICFVPPMPKKKREKRDEFYIKGNH
jgi:GcrA cell cycle regulator